MAQQGTLSPRLRSTARRIGSRSSSFVRTEQCSTRPQAWRLRAAPLRCNSHRVGWGGCEMKPQWRRRTVQAAFVLGIVALWSPRPAQAAAIVSLEYVETMLGGGQFQYDYILHNRSTVDPGEDPEGL